MKAVSTEEKNTMLKGRMVSITALVPYSSDLDQIDELLKEKAAIAPAFFKGAPLLLDLENLEEEVDVAWLDRVAAISAERGFIPVGIVGGPASLEGFAQAARIPVWPSGGTPKSTPYQKDEKQSSAVVGTALTEDQMQDSGQEPDMLRKAPEQPASKNPRESTTEKEEAHNKNASTMLLKAPVRSGQRVYAKDGDLIILSSVNPGAEVMADGHIHVYGTLRGRALAGVKGNKEARIFCHSLQADLIAIAGYYLTNEDLPSDKRGNAVQISLLKEHLNIDAL